MHTRRHVVNLCTFALILSSFVLLGAKARERSGFPVYNGQKLAKPADVRTVSEADFSIDPARVKRLDKGSLMAPRGALIRLMKVLQNTPEGRLVWQSMVDKAVRQVNLWDVPRDPDPRKFQYHSGVCQLIDRLLPVYLLTGNPELGRLIKAHALQAAELPLDFWCFARLRGCDPKFPVGGLETAALTRSFSTLMSAAGKELFTPEEKRKIDNALRQKGFRVVFNWLSKRTPAGKTINNWAAVIATGGLFAADYFHDEARRKIALKTLKRYLEDSIETDGSYGEGYSYFGYPIETVLKALPILTDAEKQELFGVSPLRRSALWITAGYFFPERPAPEDRGRFAYGDNGYLGIPPTSLAQLAAAYYRDDTLANLQFRFRGRGWDRNNWDDLLRGTILNWQPSDYTTTLPKLPCAVSFNSGETFLRKNNESDTPALSIMRKRRVRTGESHSRPESNSIAMAAYGEYFVVLCSSANYRSKVHREYDCSTRSANAIMVDGKDQLLRNAPGDARLLLLKDTPKWAAAVQDSSLRYATPMQKALRAVILLKELDAFVVIDRYEAKAGAHRYDARLHFNNRDGKAALKQVGTGEFLLSRPLADLKVLIAGSVPLTFATAPGYMHGPHRDLGVKAPAVPAGTAIELTATPQNDVQELTLFTVLIPVKHGAAAVPVKVEGPVIKAGDVTIAVPPGGISVNGEPLKPEF